MLPKEKDKNQKIFSQLVNSISEIFFLIEAKTHRILYMSPAFTTITGHDRSDFTHTDKKLLELVLPEDVRRLHIGDGWLSQPEPVDEELRIHTASNEVRWIRMRTFPIHTSDDTIEQIAGAVTDITTQKMAAEKERIHTEQIMQADKMASLGVLFSGVAHTINNSNNFISMNAPMIKEAWESITPLLKKNYEENGDYEIGGVPFSEMIDLMPELFNGIEEGARRISTIVSDLKNYARKDIGAFDEYVNLNETVTESIDLLRGLISKTTSEFHTTMPDEPIYVIGNKQKLELVIINLVKNSCEALESYDKSITVSLQSGSSMATLSIADEGKGIPDEHLKQLTDPFFTSKRDSGGKGLGLSVSARIVHNHQGTLDFESEFGKGTVARVQIPICQKGNDEK